MPLRSAPLPRMAGYLSFMRAQTKTIDEIKPGDLAVLGLPFEDPSAPFSGQSLAPRALRETSVYFGWHANPQFSHPVDIDARQDINTDGLHAKLGDLGDLTMGFVDQVHAALSDATRQIFHAEACAILLGGSDQMSKTVQNAIPDCQAIQLGGMQQDASCFHFAPIANGIISSPSGDVSLTEFARWRDESKPLFVRFDLSVFRSSLSALSDHSRLGGCDLETVSRWLWLEGWTNAGMHNGHRFALKCKINMAFLFRQ